MHGMKYASQCQVIRRKAECNKHLHRLVYSYIGLNRKSGNTHFIYASRLFGTERARCLTYVSSYKTSDRTRPFSTTQEYSPAVETKKDDSSSCSITKNNVKKNNLSKTSAYLQLGKAKLSGLVVTTTLAGFVAAGGPLYEQVQLAGCCVVGTALCSFSAAALNQIYERDRDSLMKRTRRRPLVTGVLSVNEAKLAAALWGVGGTTLLFAGTDPVTAALGFSNIGLYAGLYTFMKPRSIYNTWVGAVVGAIPPVMGWTAATGGSLLDLDAVILGSTLYYWQLPHFFALNYMYRIDYERGGFCMLSSHEADGERTSSVIMRNATYLSMIPFLSTFVGVTSNMFALEGIALNSYALWVAHRFRQERSNTNAKKVFLTSLWYLPSWLVLFLIHSKVWDEDHDRDVLRDHISDLIHSVREEGKKICIHEQVIKSATGANGSENCCPVSLSKKAPSILQSAASSALDCEGNEKVL